MTAAREKVLEEEKRKDSRALRWEGREGDEGKEGTSGRGGSPGFIVLSRSLRKWQAIPDTGRAADHHPSHEGQPASVRLECDSMQPEPDQQPSASAH